jgi:SAM-dependent methyltransferase
MTTRADGRGTLENWERMWSLSKDKWFRHPRYQEKIAGVLRKWFAGKIVLDVGCGTGDYLALLDGTCMPVGVDISIEALRLARGLRVIGSGEALPFKAGSVGGVYGIGMFHSLERPGEMLEEVRRVLAPGGILVLVVPSARSLPALLSRYLGFFLRRIFKFLESDALPDIHRLVTAKALTRLLARNGYRIASVEMVHIGYTFKSPLIRLPLLLVEKLRLRRMAEEIVVVCRPIS